MNQYNGIKGTSRKPRSVIRICSSENTDHLLITKALAAITLVNQQTTAKESRWEHIMS